MFKKLEDLYKEEDSKLAPYAVKHIESNARVYPDEDHLYRLPLQRDRDRIYHSRFFKRLQYKTQVFTNSEGDNFRTRLTHTLEVSGIARAIAQTLGLNSLLAECIALAHDLGHAPFGHAGQDILSELMKAYGGFEHNKQSLRIVQVLENRYPNFPGINLCKATLSGIMKHGGDYEDTDLYIIRKEEGPSLEAMLTDLSDEIAYNCHDIEDGLEMGFITVEDLSKVSIWKDHFEAVSKKYPDANPDIKVRTTLRSLMNHMASDLMQSIYQNLQSNKIGSHEDLHTAWNKNIRLVDYSESLQPKVIELKKFLRESLYYHEKVLKMTHRGQDIIEKLFSYFTKNPEKIPASFRTKLETEGKYRIVCDYISGMTDRYAEQIFETLD